MMENTNTSINEIASAKAHYCKGNEFYNQKDYQSAIFRV